MKYEIWLIHPTGIEKKISEFDEEELEGRLRRLIDVWGATVSNTVWIKKAKQILLTGK